MNITKRFLDACRYNDINTVKVMLDCDHRFLGDCIRNAVHTCIVYGNDDILNIIMDNLDRFSGDRKE